MPLPPLPRPQPWDVYGGYLQGRAMRVAFDAEQEQRQMEKDEHLQRMMLGKQQTERARLENEALRNPPPQPVEYNATKPFIDETTGERRYGRFPKNPDEGPFIDTGVRAPEPKSAVGDITLNAGGNVAPTPSRITKLQEKMDVNANGYARLTRIRQSYDPVYSTLPGRFKGGWAELRSKAGLDLSETDTEYLKGFTDWQTRTINNLNDHIRAITGAQLSEHEANRIMAGMPNLKDGPIKFQQKLDTIMDELQMATARAKWVLDNGYSEDMLEAISITADGAMPAVIEQWGQVQLQKMLADGVPEQQAREAVVQAIKVKFGL
jgi:hypothetical protein